MDPYGTSLCCSRTARSRQSWLLTYRVLLAPRAGKELSKVDRSPRLRIQRAIDCLSKEPRPANVKALKGRPGHFRIPVGDYRVVYKVADHRLLVMVVEVGHRREIYRSI
ncbi:MAG: type II toxin-antitoxin system RelE family toxin [Candidatus Dormibacteraceae bacterium]